MNYWKHSLLSKKKFNGIAEDYLPIHKFMDSSKLFYFDLRHRALLHHTFGIELCIMKFGETMTNSNGNTILIRDIAAEHCKEDLMGVVPTLNNWFKHAEESYIFNFKPINHPDSVLQEFIMKPYLMSGIKSSLIITHSNFGVYLTKEILGLEYSMELTNYIQGQHINEFLARLELREKWQHITDLAQLKTIENELV